MKRPMKLCGTFLTVNSLNFKRNGWHLADPICTYIFSILVVFTTVKIAKDCVSVLMEGIPLNFDEASFRS